MPPKHLFRPTFLRLLPLLALHRPSARHALAAPGGPSCITPLRSCLPTRVKVPAWFFVNASDVECTVYSLHAAHATHVVTVVTVSLASETIPPLVWQVRGGRQLVKVGAVGPVCRGECVSAPHTSTTTFRKVTKQRNDSTHPSGQHPLAKYRQQYAPPLASARVYPASLAISHLVMLFVLLL